MASKVLALVSFVHNLVHNYLLSLNLKTTTFKHNIQSRIILPSNFLIYLKFNSNDCRLYLKFIPN